MDFLNLLHEYFYQDIPRSIGVGEKNLGADNFWGPLCHKNNPRITFNMDAINFRATKSVRNLLEINTRESKYHVKIHP